MPFVKWRRLVLLSLYANTYPFSRIGVLVLQFIQSFWNPLDVFFHIINNFIHFCRFLCILIHFGFCNENNKEKNDTIYTHKIHRTQILLVAFTCCLHPAQLSNVKWIGIVETINVIECTNTNTHTHFEVVRLNSVAARIHLRMSIKRYANVFEACTVVIVLFSLTHSTPMPVC